LVENNNQPKYDIFNKNNSCLITVDSSRMSRKSTNK
jgi:hypothetical protein